MLLYFSLSLIDNLFILILVHHWAEQLHIDTIVTAKMELEQIKNDLDSGDTTRLNLLRPSDWPALFENCRFLARATDKTVWEAILGLEEAPILQPHWAALINAMSYVYATRSRDEFDAATIELANQPQDLLKHLVSLFVVLSLNLSELSSQSLCKGPYPQTIRSSEALVATYRAIEQHFNYIIAGTLDCVPSRYCSAYMLARSRSCSNLERLAGQSPLDTSTIDTPQNDLNQHHDRRSNSSSAPNQSTSMNHWNYVSTIQNAPKVPKADPSYVDACYESNEVHIHSPIDSKLQTIYEDVKKAYKLSKRNRGTFRHQRRFTTDATSCFPTLILEITGSVSELGRSYLVKIAKKLSKTNFFFEHTSCAPRTLHEAELPIITASNGPHAMIDMLTRIYYTAYGNAWSRIFFWYKLQSAMPQAMMHMAGLCWFGGLFSNDGYMICEALISHVVQSFGPGICLPCPPLFGLKAWAYSMMAALRLENINQTERILENRLGRWWKQFNYGSNADAVCCLRFRFGCDNTEAFDKLESLLLEWADKTERLIQNYLCFQDEEEARSRPSLKALRTSEADLDARDAHRQGHKVEAKEKRSYRQKSGGEVSSAAVESRVAAPEREHVHHNVHDAGRQNRSLKSCRICKVPHPTRNMLLHEKSSMLTTTLAARLDANPT